MTFLIVEKLWYILFSISQQNCIIKTISSFCDDIVDISRICIGKMQFAIRKKLSLISQHVLEASRGKSCFKVTGMNI